MEWAQPSVRDLFADQRQAVLDQLLLVKVFANNEADFQNYSEANPSTQSTIWRAQTQAQKLSLLAEEFFRRVAQATATPILLRKTALYRLIERQPVASIDPEVSEKLEAIPRQSHPGRGTAAGLAGSPAPPGSRAAASRASGAAPLRGQTSSGPAPPAARRTPPC